MASGAAPCLRVGGRTVNPPLHPRLLETLVREYWVPLVVFDPDWRVSVWNRGAQELFGLPWERAVGRPLEETGILPDRSYGEVLRRRVEARQSVVLAGAPAPRSGDRRRTLIHRFQCMGDPPLGFLCATGFQEEGEPVSASLTEWAERWPASLVPVHVLKDCLRSISDRSERLVAELGAAPAAARAEEIARSVEQLIGRLQVAEASPPSPGEQPGKHPGEHHGRET